MKCYLFIYLFICSLSGCNNIKKTNNLDNVMSDLDVEKVKNSIEKSDSNALDSLKKGIGFYKYDAFKNYNFLEAEPYEFIETNSEMKSTEVMIYNKGNYNYIVLVVGDRLVDEVDHDWENLKKTIVDIKSYPKAQQLCWYLYKQISNDSIDIRGFGIGKSTDRLKDIDEYFDCEVYDKYKVFDVDYKKGEIREIHLKDTSFCCTDGY